METHKTEGVILRAVKYGEKDQILTVFTPESGLVKLFSRSQGTRSFSRTSPLTRVEIVYSMGKGTLYPLQQATLLESYPALRQDYRTLQAGCGLLEAVRLSQFVGKSAAPLYLLLTLYLNRLQELPHPEVALMSFYLKILKYEGLLSSSPSLSLSEEESLVFELLANCRQFHDLRLIPEDQEFFKKIKKFFLENIFG